MKFKGVDLTPLMGIGGWAIDVIEKAIPNKIAYVFSENHKAWFLWDFYPTAFLGIHSIVFNIFPEERLNSELAEEIIIKPWINARFERFILSFLWWFRFLENFEETKLGEFITAIVEDYQENKQKEIKIPLLWYYQDEGLNKGAYTFLAYGSDENGNLKPVRLDKVLIAMGDLLKEAPPEIKEEKWEWENFVWIGEKGKALNSYLLLPTPVFMGSVIPTEDAPAIREILLENINALIEEYPYHLKGIELLLMGSKWHKKLLELKEILGKVNI